MATMCAYRIDLLDERMLARVSEVHPLTGGTGPAAAFRVFFDADALVLCGDVDSFGVGRLVAVLRDAEVPAHVVTLDVSQLTFIDAAGSRALAGWGHELAATGRTLVLRGASRSLRRVWSLLQLDDAAQLR
jgi:ABC-type transporter Mla MlaB component